MGNATRRFLRLACATAAAQLFACGPAMGGAYNWIGFSGLPFPPYNAFPSNDNWSNPGNWENLAVPPSSNTADITFINSAVKLTPNQDLGKSLLLHSMTFNGSGYTLSGLPIALDAAPFIQNNGSVTIANPL